MFKKTNEQYGGLSNMAPGFPLCVNGVSIRTSEALYQACRFPHIPELQRLILGERSPMTAKMIGKPHRTDSRKDWSRVRIPIMRWCLRLKLSQNWNKFSTLLLSTKDKPIVEESQKDCFWGAKPQEDGSIVGRNVLGRLLMELREELHRTDHDKLRHVDLPDIPRLLLLGEPISNMEGNEETKVEKSDLFSAGYQLGGIENADEMNERGRMIPKECKRLAEVDFPIAEVGRYSLEEKATRTGTPNQLHYWWAWRPLAACRSMLIAMLLPDPCDPKCPRSFKESARRLLSSVQRNIGNSDAALRVALLKAVAASANRTYSNAPDYLGVWRGLISAAYGENPPLVVDPFAGGGAIPLEAQRLGCEVVASDLNPVACLIQKAKLDSIQRLNGEISEQYASATAHLTELAQTRLSKYYRNGNNEETIAFIWARTINCESPNCGAEIPIMRSLWLCKKPGRKYALRAIVNKGENRVPTIEFEVFAPKSDADVDKGSIAGARATCFACGNALHPDRVREQLSRQRGGADVIFDNEGNRTRGARLLAVVTLPSSGTGRRYRSAKSIDYAPVWEAHCELSRLLKSWRNNPYSNMCPVPDEPLPPIGTLGFRVQRYGMTQWGDLFTERQKLSFLTIAEMVSEMHSSDVHRETAILMALTLSKLTDRCNALVNWGLSVECPTNLFKGNALPMGWDFCESNLLCDSSGSLPQALRSTALNAASCYTPGVSPVSPQISDACEALLPDESVDVWFTDPPYYDNVPYSCLSDFFLVWLKRALPALSILKDPFDSDNPLSPKTRENIVDTCTINGSGPKDREFFESRMAEAFKVGNKSLRLDGIGCVVFAHKTTEGWEALISGLIQGGWSIVASWPITTERSARIRAKDSAALESSVHLICRPRSNDADVGDWLGVLKELPVRVGSWIERLQGEGIRGADLVFACIGPALEIFSRYSKVETADGKEVKLDTYLEKVWEVVGRIALENVLGTDEAQARNGMAGVLEEDARLTALFLWTLQSTEKDVTANGNDPDEDDGDEDSEDEDDAPKSKAKGFSLVFDVARRFAQPLGIHLENWEDRIIETKKGVVRLLSVTERAKALFGDSGASAVAYELETDPAKAAQFELSLGVVEAAPRIRSKGRRGKPAVDVTDDDFSTEQQVTTLDRVHAAMLLQKAGRANALRALLKAEQQRGSDFLRLCNALTALYPKSSEEKRLLDAMLLAVPR